MATTSISHHQQLQEEVLKSSNPLLEEQNEIMHHKVSDDDEESEGGDDEDEVEGEEDAEEDEDEGEVESNEEGGEGENTDDEDEEDEEDGEHVGPEEILNVASLLNLSNQIPTDTDDGPNTTLLPSAFKVDVGNLLVFDYQEQVGVSQLEQAQRSTQKLFELVFNLPVTPTEVGPIADLPKCSTPIPREKPIPKRKPETKWEKFAREKGIKKTKRSSKVWDEVTQEWRPRWGRKSAKNDTVSNWLMEDKPELLAKYNAEDPFHLEKIMKRERIQKNKTSQLKNIKRADSEVSKLLPATLDITKNAPNHQKYALEKAVALAQKSTASLGKFDKRMSDEPKLKNRRSKMVSPEQEGKIADRVLKKADSLGEINLDKAARNATKDEQEKNRKRKLGQSGQKPKGKRGSKKGGGGGKKKGGSGGKFKKRKSQ